MRSAYCASYTLPHFALPLEIDGRHQRKADRPILHLSVVVVNGDQRPLLVGPGRQLYRRNGARSTLSAGATVVVVTVAVPTLTARAGLLTGTVLTDDRGCSASLNGFQLRFQGRQGIEVVSDIWFVHRDLSPQAENNTYRIHFIIQALLQ